MAINDLPLNIEALNGNPPSIDLELQFQTEILEQVRSRLTHQFKNKETIDKVIQYYLEGVGFVRNEEEKLLNLRSLNSATGVNLDILGVHVGTNREGRNDAAYRKEIYLQSLVGSSEATREDIISICRIQTDGDKLRYWDIYPAAFQIFSDGIDSSLDTAELVRKITPAGVGSETLFISSHGEVPFVLSESLLANPTLALENLDDYVSEAGQLLELNQPVGDVNTTFYGGSFGETDDATGNLIDVGGVLVGNILSEVYQI